MLDEIEGKGYDIKQVMVYINTTRGLQYTYSGVWEVLRRGRKVRCGKPLKTKENRPSNAENILKKRIDEAMDGLEEATVSFVDETAMMVDPDRKRMINTSKVKYRSKGAS